MLLDLKVDSEARVVKLVTRRISIPAARVQLPPGVTNKRKKKNKILKNK